MGTSGLAFLLEILVCVKNIPHTHKSQRNIFSFCRGICYGLVLCDAIETPRQSRNSIHV